MSEDPNQSPPPPLPPQAPEADLVCAFLQNRDVQCPKCGYNLRGVGDPACPECGRPIELSISRPGRSRGFLLFVLLALGWVLTAATMNSVRAWQTAMVESAPNLFRVFTSGTVINVTPGGTTTRTWSNTQTGSGRVSLNTGGTFTFNTGGGVTLGAAAPNARTTGRNWSAVSQTTWVNISFWMSLGIIALLNLLLALILRRRFDRESPPRRLIATACLLFLVYAGYHAVMFSRDVFL